jgi:hypothetical protein
MWLKSSHIFLYFAQENESEESEQDMFASSPEAGDRLTLTPPPARLAIFIQTLSMLRLAHFKHFCLFGNTFKS